MDETIDRYFAYRNLLACEDHLAELLMGPESAEERAMLEGMLNEVRYLRDDIIPDEANKKYHCIVKHLCAAYEAALEVSKATQEDLDALRANALRSLLYQAIEKLIGRKIVLCERCGVKEDHGIRGVQEENPGNLAESFDDGFTGDGVQGVGINRVTSVSSGEADDDSGDEDFRIKSDFEGREGKAPF